MSRRNVTRTNSAFGNSKAATVPSAAPKSGRKKGPPSSNEDGDPDLCDESESSLDDEPSEELPETADIIDVEGEILEEERAVRESETPAAKSVPGHELVRVDALSLYMQQIQRHPLLSAEEEKSLAEEYVRTGNVEIAARLVTANLRLVVKLAYEYRRAYRNIMDLIQEGNIGLMQAVKRYDPYRGVKLSSYAAWWIRAYMLRFILNNWRLVKLGTTQAQRKLFFNLSKEKARLSAMGVEPTHAEIAQRLSVDEKEVVDMDRRLSSSDTSLDVHVGDSEGKPTTRMDLMVAPSAGPDQLTEGMELQEIVRQKLEEFRGTLAGKDLVIFDRRLVAEDPVTLQQLGEEFGVSRERVRQLEARITGKLRTFLADTLGDAVSLTD